MEKKYIIVIEENGKGMIVTEKLPDGLECAASGNGFAVYYDTKIVNAMPVLVLAGRICKVIRNRAYITSEDGTPMTHHKARDTASRIRYGTIQTPAGACTGCCAIGID